MRADGIPEKLLRLMQAYYASTSMRVRAYGDESASFEVKSGVRQGCVLSPTLFNYAIDYVLSKALQNVTGVDVGGHHLQHYMGMLVVVFRYLT